MAIQVNLVKRLLKKRKRNGQHEHRWALRWMDPATGKRCCENTGTADRTMAETLQKAKWSELNIPGAAAEPAPEPVNARPAATWQECAEALQRAMEADNMRPLYVHDCLLTFDCLRRMFPEATTPADFTPDMANEYKRRRAEGDPERGVAGMSPWTIKGDLSTLKAIFGKWLSRELGLITVNPFANAKAPRCDEPEIRIVSAEEIGALFAWLSERWNGWRLPAVYLEVAALVGWRATELASMREDDILPDGHIRVLAESSKTRKTKYGWLPKVLHDELKACSAGGWAFGRFSDELRRLLMLWKRCPQHAARVRDFAPARMVGWVQDELKRFCETRQGTEPFTLHDFRRTAITGMQMAGVSEKEASVQVGCTPEVMRRHYERLDGMAIAKRNSERRLGIAGPDTIQLHLARRAGDAPAENPALDGAPNRAETVSA